MKLFTVSLDGVYLGIRWEDHPYPHIPIGEEGRGRKLVRFPIGRTFSEKIKEKVDCLYRGCHIDADVCPRCNSKVVDGKHVEDIFTYREVPVEYGSVIKTREKGTLMLVENRDESDRRALVRLAVKAGYRGSARWTSATYDTVLCSLRGSKIISYSQYKNGGCTYCGTKFAESEHHPNEGYAIKYRPLDDAGVTILAEGACAQGDAGRMGGHPEYLVIMEPGTTIRVVRSGRLYGMPPVSYLQWDGERMKFGKFDEIFPPTDQAEEGELV